MINANDVVRLEGTVTTTGTGTFTVSITEFYVDGEWHKFTTAKTLEIASADYNDTLTTQEIAYVKTKADKDAASTTLTADELAVAKSIAKKLGGADQ